MLDTSLQARMDLHRCALVRVIVLVLWLARTSAEIESNLVYRLQNLSHLLPDLVIDVPTECAGNTTSCPLIVMVPPAGNGNLYFLSYPAYLESRSSGFISVFVATIDNSTNTYSLDYTASIYKVLNGLGAVGRVYVFGRSKGGAFVQEMAIASGDALALPVAGIAVAGSPLQTVLSRSSYRHFPHANTPAVPQLSIRGIEDHIAPIDGGFCGREDDADDLFCFGEHASNEWWMQHNGCTGPRKMRSISATYHKKYSEPLGAEFNTTADYYAWEGCPAKAPVEYVMVHDCDHGEHDMLDGRTYEKFAFDFFRRLEAQTVAVS